MLLLAQINPNFLRRITPWLYAGGCVLLVAVRLVGHREWARSAGWTWDCSASSPRS